MEAIVVTLLIAFPLAGAIVRRWYALVLPLVGWPLFYVGLSTGWWGHGLGDGWQYPAAGLLVVGLITTALHVALGRRVKPRSDNGRAIFA
jgi:hypothetical protein